MTDRVGRHAAARDLAETLIIPAQQAWPSNDRLQARTGCRKSRRRAQQGGTRPGGPPILAVAPVKLPAPMPAAPRRAVMEQAVSPQVAARQRGSADRAAGAQAGPGMTPAGRATARIERRGGSLPNGHGGCPTGNTSPPNGNQSPSERVRGPARTIVMCHRAPRAAPPAGGERKLRLVWVYPDLLSTYGDRGNLLVLSRRAELRGIEVEAIEVNSDEPVPSQGDIYLLGGGEDLPQILAANRLRRMAASPGPQTAALWYLPSVPATR